MSETTQSPSMAVITLDRSQIQTVIEEMSASNPYGLGQYNDQDAAILGIESIGSLRLAHQLVKAWTGSPMIPKWIATSNNPGGTFVSCVLRGRELGFKMMESLQCLYMSPDGRLGLYGSAMIALMRKSGVKLKFTELKDGNESIGYKVWGQRQDGDEYEATFTRTDALRARLGNVHNAYPMIMCQWRAVSILFRFLCSDLSGGPLYSAEELREEIIDTTTDAPQAETGKPKNKYMEGLEPSAAKAETAPAGAETGPAPAHQDNHTQKQQSGSQAGVKAAEPEAPKAGGKRTSAAPSSPAPAPEHSDEKPQSRFQKMILAFEAQKSRIGEERYYDILASFDVKHANQFKDLETAAKAYKMIEAITDPKPEGAYSADDSDLPENMQPAEAKEEPKKKVNPLAEEISAAVAAIMQSFPRNKDGQLKKSDAAIKLCIGGFFKGVYGKGGLPAPDDANIHALRACIRLLAKNVEMYPDSVAESPAKAEATGKVVGEGMQACANFIAARSFDAKMAFWNMAIPRYADSGGRDAIEWFNGMGGAEGTKFVQELEDKDFMLLMTLAGRKVGGLWDLAEHAGKRGVKISDIQTRSGFDFSTAPVAGIEAFIHGLKNQPESDAAEPEAEPEAAEEAAKGGDEWSWV